MLGSAFYNVFNKDYNLKCTDINVNENWLSFLDFRNLKDYSDDVQSFKPDYLLHLGAITDLEYCELNKEETYDSNTLSVINAVKIANNLKIPLLFISTAGIFDGKKNYYDESDKPNPIGYYAKTKYLGEKYVINNIANYLICRAGWMMGGGIKKDKKFVNKIMKQISEGRSILNIVDDKFGTPTYTIDFAKNMKLILENQLWGLYNLVCEGETGRLDVTKEILRILNLENSIKIKPVNSDFFKKDYFALRPNSEILINKKLNDLSLNRMRNWKICLREYINEHYGEFIKK